VLDKEIRLLKSLLKFIAVSCRVAVATTLVSSMAAPAVYAGDTKKAAPAPAAKPAAPAAKPAAAPGAHGPTTAGAPAAGAHGPTTGGATAHGPTTAGAAAGAHGATTGATAGHITTASPGGNRTSTAGAGAGAARPGATAGGAHGASTFAGHPAPAGSHEVHAANGAAVRTRADGSRSDIHDAKRGMDIHHGLNGNRRIAVERSDHSRVVAERGGRGYVQHPYMFHGREFGHRTYYANGRAYDRFYGRYPYHGRYLDVYAPARFYPSGFYGYAYAPWAAPVPYAWGWGAAPWYGFYGAFYAPYPVYAAPNLWLADFIIAASLQAAYAAQVAGNAQLGPVNSEPPALLQASRWMADMLVTPADAEAKPAMSPEVKQMVADEIKDVVQQEGTEAQANTSKQDVDPAKNSVGTLLSDGKAHAFVAGVDLDLVAASGQECAFSQGDVLKVSAPPAESAETVSATVLAAKGGKECAASSVVTVNVSDLQDMRNHMREQVDDGLAELQTKQGKGGIPSAPAGSAGAAVQAGFAVGAPPPDATAANEIKQQSNDADQAEHDASAPASAGGGAGSSTTITMGQSIESVTSALGNPTRVIDLGAKKIYTYPDMKITFLNGKVANVE
jgi:hypothetical protein